MKTKKYKKIAEGNGYKYHETNYSIIVGKYSEEDYDIEIKVGKLRPGRLEVTIKGFCGDESNMILAAMELAETPLEDREEDTKDKLLNEVNRILNYVKDFDNKGLMEVLNGIEKLEDDLEIFANDFKYGLLEVEEWVIKNIDLI